MCEQTKKQHLQKLLTELYVAGFFLKEAQEKGFEYALKLLAYERAKAEHALAEIENQVQQDKLKQAKEELERCSIEYHLIQSNEK